MPYKYMCLTNFVATHCFQVSQRVPEVCGVHIQIKMVHYFGYGDLPATSHSFLFVCLQANNINDVPVLRPLSTRRWSPVVCILTLRGGQKTLQLMGKRSTPKTRLLQKEISHLMDPRKQFRHVQNKVNLKNTLLPSQLSSNRQCLTVSETYKLVVLMKMTY